MNFKPNHAIEALVLAKKGTEKSYPFGPDAAVYKIKGKMCALMSSIGITLKCDPGEAIIYRSMFEGVTPAYHMNKEHWNSVALNSDVPEDLIEKMISDSYLLVVAKLPKKDRARTLSGFQP